MTKLYFDGSARSEGSSYGFILESPIIFIHQTDTTQGTNNEAEYQGLIAGLKKAINLGVSQLDIVGDSKLVINQLTGQYKCRAKNLKPLHKEATRLLELIPEVTLQWVPRAENEADQYSRM